MRFSTSPVRVVVVLTALASTISTASAQAPPKGSTRGKDARQLAAKAQSGRNQLSEEECRQFAKSFTDAINTGNVTAFNALIDWESIFNTALTNMTMTDQQREGVLRELRNATNSELGLGAQLIKQVKNGAHFDYLRPRQNAGRQVLLYRLIIAESGGVTYFEFAVMPGANAKVRVSDIYQYSTAEFLTATFRRMLLPAVANLSRSFFDKLLKSEQDLVRDLPKVPEIVTLINQGKYQECLTALKALGPDTQKDKSILIIRMRAAQGVGEKEYAAVLDDLRRLFPNDACMVLMEIDYYTLKKDFPKVFESVDRLDKSVGGDPYLNVLRAGLSELRGDLPGAETFAKRAIEQEPTMLQPYLYLVGNSIKQEKYDVTLDTLKKQDQAFHLTYTDFSKVPQYAGFVKSPQYKEWLQYIAQKDDKKAGITKPAPASKSSLKTKKKASSAP
jgi:hypothetical protein